MIELPSFIAAALGREPKEAKLFERALTHGSHGGETYERLEFLGDRVLGLVVASWLYERFPNEPEGKMSRRYNALVERETCAEVGHALQLPPYIRLGRQARENHANLSENIIGDVVESANLVIRRPRTASIVLGGGTPKNFINQASVQAEFYSSQVGGHRYALQIVTDVPHFGGASGSSLEEARSWGKLATDAVQVSVQSDATIALPLLASALAITAPPLLEHRKPPIFELATRVMTIDGQTVPSDHFEEVNEPAV